MNWHNRYKAMGRVKCTTTENDMGMWGLPNQRQGVTLVRVFRLFDSRR